MLELKTIYLNMQFEPNNSANITSSQKYGIFESCENGIQWVETIVAFGT